MYTSKFFPNLCNIVLLCIFYPRALRNEMAWAPLDPGEAPVGTRHCAFHLIGIISFFFFFSRPHSTPCGILVPRPGMEPGPRQWKHQILTTGQPGNSRISFILQSNPKVRVLLSQLYKWRNGGLPKLKPDKWRNCNLNPGLTWTWSPDAHIHSTGCFRQNFPHLRATHPLLTAFFHWHSPPSPLFSWSVCV